MVNIQDLFGMLTNASLTYEQKNAIAELARRYRLPKYQIPVPPQEDQYKSEIGMPTDVIQKASIAPAPSDEQVDRGRMYARYLDMPSIPGETEESKLAKIKLMERQRMAKTGEGSQEPYIQRTKEELVKTAQLPIQELAMGLVGGAGVGGGKALPKIESAAIKYGKKVFEGANHSEVLAKMAKAGIDISKINKEAEGLFKLVGGKLITREQAGKLFGATHSAELEQLGAKIQSIPQIATRAFPETVRKSAGTKLKTARAIEPQIYDVRNTEELAREADQFIKSFPNEAMKVFGKKLPDDKDVAIGNKLIENMLKNPETEEMGLQYLHKWSPKLTELGRSIQAISLYGKFTPAGAVRHAENIITKAKELDPARFKNLKLTPEQSRKFMNMAEELNKLPDGRDKTLKTAEMIKEFTDLVPPNMLKKISTIQTMGQLLNLKTMARNIIGNTAFSGVENVSNAVATPIDMLISKLTGKRTVTLPSLRTQAGGWWQGLKEGGEEAWKGIDTLGVSDKFTIGNVPTFNDKFFGTLERVMGVSLKAPDRASYKAAYNEALRQMMTTAKAQKPSKEMLLQAHYEGLYRTFQDESKLAQGLSGLKRWLNKLTGSEDFGIGDFILKYPKTPANILDRALNYSPVGLVKNLLDMGKVLEPTFNQRETAMGISRGLVGTAGIASATILSSLGIITAKPEKDAELRGLQKQSGLGGYQVNVSALMRFLMSGLNPKAAKIRKGDQLMTYDWAQPISINMAIGSDLAEMLKKKDISSFVDLAYRIPDIAGSGAETLIEQPLLQGIKRMGQARDIGQGIQETLKSAPSSFIPTISGQIAQQGDNVARVMDSDNPLKEAFATRIMGKVPGLRQKLPARLGIYGEPMEQYQGGGNTPLNVYLNPAFMSKYIPDKVSEELLRLSRETGLKNHIPTLVGKRLNIGGRKSVVLTPEERMRLQKESGKLLKSNMSRWIESPEYQSMSDSDKQKALSDAVSMVNKAIKSDYFAKMNSVDRIKLVVDTAETIDANAERDSLLNSLYQDDIITEEEAKKIIDEYRKRKSKKGFFEGLSK